VVPGILANPRRNKVNRDSQTPTVSIAIVGSGGSGVVTAGQLLLEAAGRSGLYGIMARSSGPQIR